MRRQLPIIHQTAQQLCDDATQHQEAMLRMYQQGVQDAEDTIHRIEVMYDHKQSVLCALMQLEKKLFKIGEEINEAKQTI